MIEDCMIIGYEFFRITQPESKPGCFFEIKLGMLEIFFCESDVLVLLEKTIGRMNMVASEKKFYCSSSIDSTCF